MRREQLLYTGFLAKLAQELQPLVDSVSQPCQTAHAEAIRYLYIPIGGNKNAVMSTLLIFTFVALWHDLSMRLLAWGWLVSLFIIPELAARHFVPLKKVGNRHNL